MAGEKSNSYSPWSAIGRANSEAKVEKSPAEETPRAATPKIDSSNDGKPAAALASKEVADVLKTTEAEVAEQEEVVEYSEDELQEMSLKELQALAKDAGVDFKGMSKDELIEAILAETGVEEIVLKDDEESLETEEIDGEMSLEEAMALLGEDSETEEDFAEGEFEVVEEEVLEGDVNFEESGNN